LSTTALVIVGLVRSPHSNRMCASIKHS